MRKMFTRALPNIVCQVYKYFNIFKENFYIEKNNYKFLVTHKFNMNKMRKRNLKSTRKYYITVHQSPKIISAGDA